MAVDPALLAQLDPDAQQLLEMAQGRPSMSEVPLAQARAGFVTSRLANSPDPAPVGEVRDLIATGPHGAIPVRVYRPASPSPLTALPAVLYFHGGGWVVGDLDSHDPTCRQLANAGSCTVVAVHYRLAPEHVFPAAVDDGYAALQWLASNAAELRVDPARIAVAGDSAGGNVAAVVALQARDAGGPRLAAQLLIYPVVDVSREHDSYARIGNAFTLTADAMRWFTNVYVPNARDRADWRASPLRAAHLRDLPPALVVTAGCDPLRDEGETYARRLEADGVRVTYRNYPGQMHGFAGSGRFVKAADEVLGLMVSHLP